MRVCLFVCVCGGGFVLLSCLLLCGVYELQTENPSDEHFNEITMATKQIGKLISRSNCEAVGSFFSPRWRLCEVDLMS